VARKKAIRLTRFEIEVMEVLWDLGNGSIREIHERLPEHKQVAYTTVQTVVRRLEDKGALRQIKKIGTAFIFEPLVTRKAAHLRLIDDLLDTSRIVAGKIQLELRPVDLGGVVRDVLAHAAQDPGAAALLCPPALDARCVLKGDRDRLHQVVTNLVANALKFTLAGGRVDVRLRRGRDEVELSVRDTGEGISADQLPHIFDRFHQVDRSHTRRHGGLGLGLAIVRHLVEAHGGSVHAESAGRGHGACFTVRLPAADDTDQAAAVSRAAPVASEQLLAGLRVLFVDDNPEARALVGTVLESAGADVSIAASAVEGLERLRKHAVDVVLTDIGMPDLDGYDFVMRLRETERAANRTPVCAIALTAHAGAEDRRRALTGGFQGYVAKPSDPDELVRVVRDVYEESRT